jgi:hypothetical protein
MGASVLYFFGISMGSEKIPFFIKLKFAKSANVTENFFHQS